MFYHTHAACAAYGNRRRARDAFMSPAMRRIRILWYACVMWTKLGRSVKLADGILAARFETVFRARISGALVR